ncbi:MAG: hypothetical protein JWL64_2243 [Frankiales bacterium]|nr:hypothetical protein [Frankiales bacterium]
MARLTSDWTELRLAVAAVVLSAVITAAVAMLADAPYDLLGVGAVVFTVAVALSLDAFGGIAAGLLGAAGLIAARKWAGDWTTAEFGLGVTLTLALVLLGWLCGLVTRRLGEPSGSGARGHALSEPYAPAYGSLGLLPAAAATARLEEEVARARQFRRPLTVVLLGVEITDRSLPEASRAAALRGVARLLESLVPESAVPFALTADELGAVLLETAGTQAWDVLGPVIDAARRASFSAGGQEERRSLRDCVQLHAALVELTPDLLHAEDVLAAARRSLALDSRTGAGADQPAGAEIE